MLRAAVVAVGIVGVLVAFWVVTVFTGFGPLGRYPKADLDALATKINDSCAPDGTATADYLWGRVDTAGLPTGGGTDLTAEEQAMLGTVQKQAFVCGPVP